MERCRAILDYLEDQELVEIEERGTKRSNMSARWVGPLRWSYIAGNAELYGLSSTGNLAHEWVLDDRLGVLYPKMRRVEEDTAESLLTVIKDRELEYRTLESGYSREALLLLNAQGFEEPRTVGQIAQAIGRTVVRALAVLHELETTGDAMKKGDAWHLSEKAVHIRKRRAALKGRIHQLHIKHASRRANKQSRGLDRTQRRKESTRSLKGARPKTGDALWKEIQEKVG